MLLRFMIIQGLASLLSYFSVIFSIYLGSLAIHMVLATTAYTSQGGILTINWYSSGAVHFMASNNDCGVRDFDMERFQLSKHFSFSWPVNVSNIYIYNFFICCKFFDFVKIPVGFVFYYLK